MLSQLFILRKHARRRCQHVALSAFLLMMTVVNAASAATDEVADFYRGKQIKIYIRAAPGGNYDVYSRLLGRYLTRYLPGNPTVLPINMPGGGGLVALNYVANVAPQDGTVLTMITPSFPMEQALGLDKNIKVDLRTLGWIGNMSDSSVIYFTNKSSPTRTLEDARMRQTLVAATGNGSIVTELVAVYNNMLGTHFKIIFGYPSGPDMTLAMERGEVEGRSTTNPEVLLGSGATAAEIRARYNFIIQTGMKKLPGYDDVPLLRDLAHNDNEKRVFDFVSQAVAISRPVVATPNVPPDRIAALRRAFDAALADSDLLANAGKEELEIAPMNGENVKALVEEMIETPPQALAQIGEAITLRPSDAAGGNRSGSAK